MFFALPSFYFFILESNFKQENAKSASVTNTLGSYSITSKDSMLPPTEKSRLSEKIPVITQTSAAQTSELAVFDKKYGTTEILCAPHIPIS